MWRANKKVDKVHKKLMHTNKRATYVCIANTRITTNT